MNTFAKTVVLVGSLLLVAACAPHSTTTTDAGTPTDAGHPSCPDGGTCTVHLPSTVTVRARVYQYPWEQPEPAAWVAYQDGDGTWTQAAGMDAGFALSIKDPGGRYGLASKCPGDTSVNVYLGTVTEKSDWTVDCYTLSLPAAIPVVATVGTWPAGGTLSHVFVGGGHATDNVEGNPDTVNVLPGLQDAFAFVTGADGTRWLGGGMQHDLDVTAATSVSLTLDITPVELSVSYSAPAPAGTLGAASYLLLKNGTTVNLPMAAGAATTADVVPSSAEDAKDLSLVGASTFVSAGDTRGAFAVFHQPPSALTLIGPAEVTSVTATVVNASGTAVPSVTWEGGPSGAAVGASFHQGSRVWLFRESATRVAGNSSLTLPNVTAAAGFDTTQAFDLASDVTGDLSVIGATGGPADAFFDFNTDGHARTFRDQQTFTYATKSFTWAH